MALTKVAQRLLLTKFPQLESTTVIKTASKGRTQARAAGRDEVTPTARPFSPVPEVDPSQTGGPLETRAVAHPVGAIVQLKLPQVLNGALRPTTTQLSATGTQRPTATTTQTVAPAQRTGAV